MAFGPGYGPAGNGRQRLRTSSADREHAVSMLMKAFTEGRLTKDELDTRTERALTARTYADLDALVSDLPAPPPPPAVPHAAPATRTNMLAVLALACGVAEFFTGGLTAIPAVALGHMARRQVRRTGGAGGGLALAGLVLGWIGIVMLVAFVVGAIGAASAIAHSQGFGPPG